MSDGRIYTSTPAREQAHQAYTRRLLLVTPGPAVLPMPDAIYSPQAAAV
jgi:hypothetical protein